MKIEKLSNLILNNEQRNILDKIINNHGNVYLVGGCLRNFFLCVDINDIDVEVNNISFDKLKNILKDDILFINDKFKVITTKNKMDISLTRKETKIGHCYDDYELSFDNIAIKDTVLRRDFTMNALMYDYRNNKILDYVNGMKDINDRIINVVNKDTYQEDSIRVLRLLKYAFIYNLKISEDCKNVNIGLSKYLWYQPSTKTINLFRSIILSSYFNIDEFFFYLDDFLELDKLKEHLTINKFHPEKSLFKHVKGCLIALSYFKNKLGTREYYLVFIALLFHDYGKLLTNKDHEIESVIYFEKYQPYFCENKKDIKMITNLINDHMKIRELAEGNNIEEMKLLKNKYRNLFYLLEIIGTCDYAGRVINYDINEIDERINTYQNDIIKKYRMIK
ncbi:MAG: hypothetical protein LBR40_05980 [Bacilli bacterium]|nr:hypothetical protein [Bacilli bacterium]